MYCRDIELNPGPKSSLLLGLPICHWNLNSLADHNCYLLMNDCVLFHDDHPYNVKRRKVHIYYKICLALLGILTQKKHPKTKLQCLRKIQRWTFGSLLHQINSF